MGVLGDMVMPTLTHLLLLHLCLLCSHPLSWTQAHSRRLFLLRNLREACISRLPTPTYSATAILLRCRRGINPLLPPPREAGPAVKDDLGQAPVVGALLPSCRDM